MRDEGDVAQRAIEGMTPAQLLARSEELYRQAKEHRAAARACEEMALMLYAEAYHGKAAIQAVREGNHEP